MKENLLSHLNLIFQALNIKPGFDVYDCLSGELPSWALGYNHPQQFLICTPAIEFKDRLGSFIGKELFIRDNVLFWYDGDYIENSAINQHSTATSDDIEDVEYLKTSTRLPSWLDDYIFGTLEAQYAPDHERFGYNLDLSEKDIRVYLGTYFPRSYSESFCIFDNIFQNQALKALFNNKISIRIASIGAGTGGDLIGLLTIIDKYLTHDKHISILAIDGNNAALQILTKVVNKFKSLTKLRLSLDTQCIKLDTISNLVTTDWGDSFDFILSSKMICEIISAGAGKADNAYYEFTTKILPLISDTGIFYLLDVTTRQKHSAYNPFLLNQQVNDAIREMPTYKTIIPLPCSIYSHKCFNGCFYHKVFSITHSRAKDDRSKVAYRIIVNKALADSIINIDSNGKYYIHSDNTCPLTEQTSYGRYYDAFLLPISPDISMAEYREGLPISDTVELIDYDSSEMLPLRPTAIDDIQDIGTCDEASNNDEIFEESSYYTGCYIIDTNIFLDKPDIISNIDSDYFVVLSAKVLDELDHLKIKKNMSPARKKRVNKALKHISESLSNEEREIIMEDSDTHLLPKDFDKNSPDNKILSVALKFLDENPILLTSDYGLQARAKSLGIKSISLKDFTKEINN